MNEDRYMAVKNAVFLEQVQQRGVDLMDLVSRAVALGVETALAWQPEPDEVLEVPPAFRRWMRPATEGDVITGADLSRYEQELEGQLDTVLRYVQLRDGWIPQSDTEALVEFQNLGLRVKAIAEARKMRRGEK